MLGDPTTHFLPRISAADFEAFSRLLENDIAPTFEKWSESHQERVSFWSERAKVIEVDVNPDEFAAFCHRASRGYDAKALLDFAALRGKAKT
jgi:hypothetical protein